MHDGLKIVSVAVRHVAFGADGVGFSAVLEANCQIPIGTHLLDITVGDLAARRLSIIVVGEAFALKVDVFVAWNLIRGLNEQSMALLTIATPMFVF